MRQVDNRRREFLFTTAPRALCIACGGGLSMLLAACDTVDEGEPVVHIDREPKLQHAGGAVRKRFAKINNSEAIFIIRNSETEFSAFAAQCTHQGVELNLPKEGTIQCPNHGSRFRITDGTVVDGEAYNPLRRFPVRYDSAAKTVSIG